MLYDVAAVFTSVAIGPVAGAFSALETSSYSVSSHSPTVRSWDIFSTLDPDTSAVDSAPAAITGSTVGQPSESDPAEFVQGSGMLQRLSLIGAAAIPDYLAAHPDAVTALLASPPAATDVTLWWTSLDVDRRTALRSAAPELVGNLDGVPYPMRDLANRSVLSRTISDLRATVGGNAGRTVIETAKQQLTMLQSIDSALATPPSGPRRTLMSLDVTGQGRAAIVLGDLRTADYVTYLVPGMFFTIENQMADWTDAASRLYDEQVSWLALFDKREGVSDSRTVATIAWIGYHTPNLTNVGGIQNAEEGRDALAGVIEGLQALRAGDEPYVSVIAHSYGTTAALLALTEYDFEIDALALVGSPGSPAKSVDELHVRDGNVYVGEAPWDPIPNSAYFGSDPGSASYGAHPLGVGGGVDAITHRALLPSSGHNEYFSPGTESMRNFALISIGKGWLVSDGTVSDAVLADGSSY